MPWEHLDTHAQQLQPIRRRSALTMRDPQQPGGGSTDGGRAPLEVASLDLEDFSTGTGGPPREIFMNVRERQTSILDEARRTAEQMVEQGRLSRDAELEAARREGHQAGYEQGYGDGLATADRETAGLIATAESIATHVARERAQLLEGGEGELVELALAIAERIVCAAIDVEPELVVDVCRAAMRKAFQRETLTVLANPADLHMLREAGPQLAAELGGVRHLEFVEERRLERGGVIVRTPAGEIDATFDGKAGKIAESLRELVSTRRAERRAMPEAA
jgi:flagellar assembly protein FliH